MSKGLVETVTEFFKPHAPLWACELTQEHVIVAGANSRRSGIASKAALRLPVSAGREAPRQLLVKEALSHAGFKGSEIAVVVPDGAARIAFLTAENLSNKPDEQESFVRWKLKKSVPFDVDAAQIAYRIIGPHRDGPGVDMLVALAPRSVVQEYELLFESMDVHAGMVLPSTLAVLNLFQAPAGDTLFVKVAPDCVTTTVFQHGRVQFYRRVTDAPLYDSVYPTVLYYQDKLGGTVFERFYVCGYGADLRPALGAIEDKLGLPADRIGPRAVEDVYKPALGAIHLNPGRAL